MPPSEEFKQKLQEHKKTLQPHERDMIEKAEKAFDKSPQDGALAILDNMDALRKSYEKRIRAASPTNIASVIQECIDDFDKVWEFAKSSRAEMK